MKNDIIRKVIWNSLTHRKAHDVGHFILTPLKNIRYNSLSLFEH